jgi:hypothetical protein
MLRLEILGLADVRERLGVFARELDDFGDLWDAISEIMVEHSFETFDSEGFGTWEPLKPATVAEKERQGYPPEPMIRTESLLLSLTDPFQAAEVGQGRSSLGTFTAKTFSWGTEVDNERGETYAEFHQEGPLHNTRLPVRNVIMVTPVLELKVEQAMEDFVEEKLREAGLDG